MQLRKKLLMLLLSVCLVLEQTPVYADVLSADGIEEENSGTVSDSSITEDEGEETEDEEIEVSSNTVSEDSAPQDETTVSQDEIVVSQNEAEDSEPDGKNESYEDAKRRLEELYEKDSLTEEELEEAALLKEMIAGNTSEEALTGAAQCISNEWLEIAMNSSGEFTIGTIEGNPNYETDNNRKLLYGHPNPRTSQTLIKVGNQQFLFDADSTYIDQENGIATAKMLHDNIEITQKLTFFQTASSGYEDTVRISYTAKNKGGSEADVGIRIMMDTMLASNDHAPFKIPSRGNVTICQEYSGSEISQTYQVYDNLDKPTTIASGALWLEGERRPDKVQFTRWPDIVDSSWDYAPRVGSNLGDSAVGIYFNPVSLTAGRSASVCTYYGTGLGLTGSAGEEIDVSIPLKNDEIGIYTVDSVTGKALKGATVNIPGIGSRTTDEKGLALFGSIPDSAFHTNKEISVTMEGYGTKSFSKRLRSGAYFSLGMRKPGDTKPLVDSVMTSSVNSRYDKIDLRSEVIYLNANSSKIEATNRNKEMIRIKVTPDSDTTDHVYQLYKNDEIIQENESGEFELTTICKDSDNKNFTVNRLCDFDEGDRVYVRIVSSTGEESKKTQIGIKISAPGSYFSTGVQDVEITDELEFALPDTEIMQLLLGTDKYKLSALQSPLTVAVDQDGKIKVALNKDKSKDWGQTKEDYTKAVIERSNAAKAFGGTPSSFGAGKANLKAEISGYGEGYQQNGVWNVNLGIVLRVSGDASYTQQFFIGVIPLYITVGAGAEASAVIEAQVVNENKMSLNISQGTFEPSISLYAELGAGASGFLSAGVQGKGTLLYSNDFVRKYQKVDLTAQASVELHAILYSKSIKIAKQTWHLWDSNQPKNAGADSEPPVGGQLYSADGFKLTSRDYLEAGDETLSRASAGTTILNHGVYVDAKPVMVNVGSKVYRFWLEDTASLSGVTARSASNRTALVYSKYNGSGWSEPAMVLKNDDGKADYGFDVYAAGNAVYVAYQHSNKVFTDETGADATLEDIEAMAKSSEIYYAKIDTDTDTLSDSIKVGRTTEHGAMNPRIVLKGSQITVAWAENDKDIVIANGEQDDLGNTSICTASFAEGAASIQEGFRSNVSASYPISTMDLGILEENVCIAYVLDTDKNYATLSDRELYLVKEVTAGSASTPAAVVKKETSNVTMDENPRFANIAGSNVLMWYEGDNYCYTDDVDFAEGSTKRVFSEDKIPGTAHSDYIILEGAAPAIVWYSAKGQNTGDDLTTSISFYETKYDNGTWGNVFKLGKVSDVTDGILMNPSGYMDGSGREHILYGIIQYKEDGTVNLSQLREMVFNENKELTFDGIEYDPNKACSEGTVSVTVSLTNTGNTAIENPAIKIGSSSYPQENVTIVPGERKEITIEHTFPVFTGTQEYSVLVSCSGVSIAGDPQVIQAGYTDLTVDTGERMMIGDKEYVPLVITNNSSTDAQGVNVKVMADNVNEGAVLLDYNCTNIESNSAITVFCAADTLEETNEVFYRVVSDTKEIGETVINGNTGMIGVGNEVPDVLETNSFAINVNSEDAGTIVGSYESSYETNQVIPIQAEARSGYVFTGWTSDEGTPFEDYRSLSTDFIMPAKAVHVFANFATPNPLTGLTIPENLAMHPGEANTLEAVKAPTDTTDFLTWSSSDPQVVTVDAYTGLIEAVAEGEADITVISESDPGITDTCHVTVTKEGLTSIRMVFPEIQIAGLNQKKQIRTVLRPVNCKDTIYWTSNHPEIAEVDNQGIVTTAAVGTAEITAANEDGTIKAVCRVTVINPIMGIYLNEVSLGILNGETETITVSSSPAGALDSIPAEEIVWSIPDTDVVQAAVAEDHRSVQVKGVGNGTALIAVKIGEEEAVCSVTVTTPIESIAFDSSGYVMRVNESKYLEPVLSPSNAKGNITYRTSDYSVATVYDSGRITARSCGSAVITATADTGAFATIKVTVVENTRGTKSIASAKVSKIKDGVYTGEEILPKITVKDGRKKLSYGSDYMLEFSNNTDAGTAYVKLLGIGDYYGSVSYSFTIKRAPLKKAKIFADDMTASAEAVKPVLQGIFGKVRLEEGVDYTIEKVEKTNKKGAGKIVLNGTGNFQGAVNIRVSVFDQDTKLLNQSAVENTLGNDYTYTFCNSAVMPVLYLTDESGQSIPVSSRNYKISYKNNKNAGWAYAEIKSKSKDVKGSIKFLYYIRPLDLTESYTLSEIKDQTYKGKPVHPKVQVMKASNVKSLKKKLGAKDYTCSYINCREAGSDAAAIVEGKGNYTGVIHRKFTIKEKTKKK